MYFFICFFLISLDQFVKKICIDKLSSISSVEVIKDFFYLTYVENRGAAFGIFEGGRIFFVLVALIACFICLFYFFKAKQSKFKPFFRTSLIFILAGSIGNLIDRVFRGFVVDMFHFVFLGKNFAVFNIADILIVVGSFLLVFILIYNDFLEKAKQE